MKREGDFSWVPIHALSKLKTMRPPDRPDPKLGAAIQSLRKARGESPASCAMRAEIEESELRRIEAGEIDPTWGTVRAIASVLGSSPEEISRLTVKDDTERKRPSGCDL
jgi:transcriptional regulator with XRE-family HTH domain